MFSPEKGTDKMLTQQSVHLLHSKTNKQTNKHNKIYTNNQEKSYPD